MKRVEARARLRDMERTLTAVRRAAQRVQEFEVEGAGRWVAFRADEGPDASVQKVEDDVDAILLLGHEVSAIIDRLESFLASDTTPEEHGASTHD